MESGKPENIIPCKLIADYNYLSGANDTWLSVQKMLIIPWSSQINCLRWVIWNFLYPELVLYIEKLSLNIPGEPAPLAQELALESKENLYE